MLLIEDSFISCKNQAKRVNDGREVGDIMDIVKSVFDHSNLNTLEHLWHVLFYVMNAILEQKSSNSFPLVHEVKRVPLFMIVCYAQLLQKGIFMEKRRIFWRLLVGNR